MTPSPFIIALILNTNRRADTIECLRSLQGNHYPELLTIVLDNASVDGSKEAIAAEFPSVLVESLQVNKGYTGNNNTGIQIALEKKADWILVLNEDTILSADCLEEMVRVGMSSEDVGVVGPLVYHFDEPDVIQSAGAAMDQFWISRHIGMNEKDEGQYSQVREVDWISGCALLIRAEALRQVDWFDERFFYYNEETDLCYRLHKQGWKLLIAPKAKLWHKGVQRNYSPSASISYYYLRNQLLFLKKNHAPLSVRLYNWGYFLRTVLSWSVKPKWKHMKLHRDAMLDGMRDYLLGHWGKRPDHASH